MATNSWIVEVETQVAASRLFKAAVHEWHDLAPKVLPEIVVSASVLEGEGGPGSIRQLNFSPVLPFQYVQERLDSVDHENFECKMSLIAGGPLGTEVESATSHFKIVAAASGGSVCKVVTSYKLLPGVENSDDKVAKSKESVTGFIKAAEGFLLANPDAYV